MPEVSGTREKILVQAAGLFTQHGYAGTSTRDIAECVGITQPGLYRHFQSKADIFLTLADQILTPWLMFAKQAQESGGTAAEKLLWLMREICWSCVESPYEFTFLLTNPSMTDTQFESPRKTYKEVAKRMGQLIKQGVEQQEFRELNPKIVFHMCMSLTDVLIFPTTGSAKEKIEEILALISYGVIVDRSHAEKALEHTLNRSV